MTRTEMARLLGAVGFNEIDGKRMLVIAERESLLDPSARSPHDDRGLFQIHSGWIPVLIEAGVITHGDQLFDAECNARAAKWIFDRNGGDAWSIP